MFAICLGLLPALAMAAEPGTGTPPKADATLTETYWRIDQLDGEALPAASGQREAHIVLKHGDPPRFSATVGCNQMLGGYTLSDGGIRFSPAASTRMACPPPLDTLERTLGESLQQTASYEITGETMTLKTESGAVVARLTAVYLK